MPDGAAALKYNYFNLLSVHQNQEKPCNEEVIACLGLRVLPRVWYAGRCSRIYCRWFEKNELPRRKQRGITKNVDRGRRKRRGIRPVEAVPKALLESFLFFTFNFNWAFGTAPIESFTLRSPFLSKEVVCLSKACHSEPRLLFSGAKNLMPPYIKGKRFFALLPAPPPGQRSEWQFSEICQSSVMKRIHEKLLIYTGIIPSLQRNTW